MFYFTVHPGDMMRTRIIGQCAVMIVASAFWDDARQRFRIRRPPADHISALTIDSGGFTAAKRWGCYPWTREQYVEFIRQEIRDIPLTFCASMDYACEREVNRETFATNRERIRQTIENEMQLRALAPDLPWLGVLQGNTLDERLFDVRCRRRLGLIFPLMGIGSICGRRASEAATVIRSYRRWLPGVRYHAFGLDCRTLDGRDDVAAAVQSWDSYAWNWPRGDRGASRPSFLLRAGGESWSTYTLRLADAYHASAIVPRLTVSRQLPLDRVG